MKSINQSNSIKRAVYLLLIIFMGTCGLILVNYYQNRINTNAINALQKDSLEVVQNKARTLESELQKFSLLPIALTDDRYVLEAIRPETTNSLKIDTLNVKLASLAQRTGAPYIFVVNNLGETIASSNYNQDDSFVGRKYEFRPYFKEAIRYGEAEYFAKGERTGKAGLFLARRIDDNQTSLGVIVVKVEFDATAQRWNENNSITFVTNSDGIILFSTDARLNYSTVKELDTKRRQEIIASKQFANEPLQKSPISITSSQNQTQISKLKSLIQSVQISGLDWHIHRQVDTSPALIAVAPKIKLHLLSAATLIFSIGLFVSWRVSRERQRKATTEFLKTEVFNQTRELSQTNKQLEYEIQQRERINNRFRRAREELALANRLGSIGAITTSVAHEINQPLAAIKAFAENSHKFIERKRYDSARENLTSIIELTSKINSITAELRRYAHRGIPNIGRSIQQIFLKDVIQGVELLIGERLRNEGIQFINSWKNHPNQNISVLAGRVRLEQVIVNVLQNSIEALEHNDNPKIRLDIQDNEKRIAIVISDNGPGIKNEIKNEIYNPFFTQKENGLGIGLGIAKDIMTEFGGSIKTDTSILGGATFKLTLKKYD